MVKKDVGEKCGSSKVFWGAFFGSLAAYIVLFLVTWLLAVIARGG